MSHRVIWSSGRQERRTLDSEVYIVNDEPGVRLPEGANAFSFHSPSDLDVPRLSLGLYDSGAKLTYVPD